VIPVPPKFRALSMPRNVLGVVAAALAAAVLLPSSAQAGTYKMYNCSPPGLSIAKPTPGPWHIYNDPASGVQSVSNCLGGGVMALGFPLSGGVYLMNAFGRAGFEVRAPAGVAISRVKTWSLADLKTAAYDQATCPGCLQLTFPENLGPNGSASYNGSVGAGLPDDGFVTAYDAPTAAHQMGLACGNGAAGNPCKLVNSPNLTISGTEVDLVESGLPAGKIDGGSLASVGTKAGVATLSFTASDALSGVQTVQVLLDGVVAGAADYSRNLTVPVAQQGGGACTYTDFAACPPAETGDIAVDTTKVPDGAHTLTLRVIDAAGNTKDVAGSPITTSNAVVVGAPNGNGASRAAKLTAAFTTTKKTSRHLGFDARPTIKGTLVNEGGQPIGGATVVIRVRPRQAGAIASQVATVATSPDGRYSFKIPGGPSRTIIVEYTAFGGDPAPAASAKLRAVVRARVSASIRPRSVRAGQKLTLSGRLRLLPRSGVEVKIQARDGRKWRTVDDVRTTRGGSYHWDYRFKGSARGHTFAFRARVSSPVYPFAAGNSKATLVRVR
jgi:hypothetical protein